jgi:hypothetical protein
LEDLLGGISKAIVLSSLFSGCREKLIEIATSFAKVRLQSSFTNYSVWKTRDVDYFITFYYASFNNGSNGPIFAKCMSLKMALSF